MYIKKIEGKELSDVIKLYNLWKFTSHYREWKNHKNALKNNLNLIWR